MNKKRWIWASVAVFVLLNVWDFVVHGVLLASLYQQSASVWRPPVDMQRLIWIFWVGYLLFAPFFTLIYSKGYESGKSGAGQGFRFGLYVGAMLSVMGSYVWYVVLPIPYALAAWWFVSTVLQCIAAGIVTGLIYRQ